LFQRCLDGVGDRSGAHVGEHSDELFGFAGLAEQAEQGHQGQQRWEQCQHGVVGQCGGEVGALVVAEFPQGFVGNVFPGRFGQFCR
jgi:hypothetical protein